MVAFLFWLITITTDGYYCFFWQNDRCYISIWGGLNPQSRWIPWQCFLILLQNYKRHHNKCESSCIEANNAGELDFACLNWPYLSLLHQHSCTDNRSDDLDIDDLRSVSSTLAGFVMLSLGVGILWDLWCPVLLPNFDHNAPEEPAN